MANHPELDAEQAYIDHAYECLERTKRIVESMREGVVDGQGGTFQNRFERDVVWDRVGVRLGQLEIGDRSLVFGRIDTDPAGDRPEGDRPGPGPDETYYIGRIAVADEHSDPVVVDWRAPLAESFYRATGVDPMGLRRRRHFASRGPTLLGIDDELFGSATAALDQGRCRATARSSRRSRSPAPAGCPTSSAPSRPSRTASSAPSWPGSWSSRAGPGTGKTVVALHRAAYLLYSHRFPLEGQGVLVVGPNRLFLSYIEQVLPSLGEAGVQIAVLSDLIPHVRVSGTDRTEVAHVKGDQRMIRVIRKAVRDRQRPLRETAAGALRPAAAVAHPRGVRGDHPPGPTAGAVPQRRTSPRRAARCSRRWRRPRATSRPRRSCASGCAASRWCARRWSACGRC